MRDMVPSRDRSIRNIPIPKNHRRSPVIESQEFDDELEMRPRRRTRRGPRRVFFILIIAVALLCAGGGLLLSTLFAGSVVTVYPRTASVSTTEPISASPNAPSGTLAYNTISLNTAASTTVAASGTQKVSRQASGVITISNEFNTESQRLIANTRFVTNDGKIYRIHDSVVVPGMKGTTPGKATITAYADSPGVEYNKSGVVELMVAKFKEDKDPRATKFVVRAEGGFSGGFVGNEPAVAAADLAAAKQALKDNLEKASQTSVSSQIPEGYILVQGSMIYTFSDVSQTPQDSNKATIAQSVVATAIIIKSNELASALARAKVDEYAGEPVDFGDQTAVKVSVAAPLAAPVGKLDIKVEGTPLIVWQHDSVALKSALMGKKKSEFESIIASFRPAITRAEAKVRPFWQSTFPQDGEKITIIDSLPK